MRNLFSFNDFLNEGLKDNMTGYTEEEMKNNFLNGEIMIDKYINICKENNFKLPTNDEIKIAISHLPVGQKVEVAAEYGYIDIVKDAIKNGAKDIKNAMVSNSDFTPLNRALFNAVMNNNSEMVKYLISEGADINYADGHILYNAINRDIKIVKLALENGANINSPGLNLFKHICEEGKVDLVKLFISYGANVTNSNIIQAAFPYGGIPVLKILLDNGADPKYISEDVIWCAEVMNGHPKEAAFIRMYKLGKGIKDTTTTVVNKFKQFIKK